MDLSTLKRSIYFFQLYKSATSSTYLTWSHYKYLLSIESDEKRKWYEDRAEAQQWNVLTLAQAIKEDRYAQAKGAKGKSQRRKRKTLKRPEDPTYIYKAYVKRVIDGDTLLLMVDLGFTVFKEQRVRLNFIDAPDLETPEGAKAYEFVRRELSKVEFVMVKTNKIDIYGRYLGDVFYSVRETDKAKIFKSGSYLNQVLVNQGLVKAF